MSCPTEDDFAQLLQGMLPAARRAELEAHVDACEPCTELLAGLGRVCAPSVRAVSRAPAAISEQERAETLAVLSRPMVDAAPSRAREAPWRAVLEAEAALAGAYSLWCALTLRIAWSASVAPLDAASSMAALSSASAITRVVLMSVLLIWPLFGLLGASMTVYGLARGRRWARPLARAHAWLSALTGLMLPLAALVLLELRVAPETISQRTAG